MKELEELIKELENNIKINDKLGVMPTVYIPYILDRLYQIKEGVKNEK